MGLFDRLMTMLGWGATLVEPQGISTDKVFPIHHFNKYYQKEMLDELNSSQLERATTALTGKMHELSIAMTFDQLLRPSEHKYMMESQASAYRSSGPETKLSETCLKEYQLCEGGEVIDGPYTTTRNIGDWLRDENRSAFLFPVNNAHPDLMFILERKGEGSDDSGGPRTDRIICALQSKLGSIHSFPEQVRHLRPDEWYMTKTQMKAKAETMTDAQKTAVAGLEDFKKEKFLLILSSAGDEPEEGAASGGQSKKGDEDELFPPAFDRAVRKDGKNEFGNFYFCYMPPGDVKTIFLEGYERFLKQLRHKEDPF